jgi:Fe-S cluster biogenesis protein NfuA
MSDVEAAGARVEQLLTEIEAAGDPAVSRRAEGLVRALVELYGAGLSRIVALAGEPGSELLRRLADDPVVAGLLVLHQLHPASTQERVAGALARVRPYLGSHAGDVELLEVDDGVVRLRLTGSCHGCPSSEATVRDAIERAIAESAPEVVEVTVDGAVSEPAPVPQPLLQIQTSPPHPYAGVGCPATPGQAAR